VFRERHDFAPGQKIRLRPRSEMAHLFDPSSGDRI
jgi:multiple sugar transport system ATP-binding protein